MKSLLLAIALVALPSASLACDAMDRFLRTKWKQASPIYETVDVTTKQRVVVFDMGDKVSPDQRYAVVWLDTKTCTVEAEFRDLPGMMYIMESSVYERF